MTEEFNKDKLTSYIDRIETLEAEKADLQTDITNVYNEAKGDGFDPKVMRQIIKLRKMTPPDRAESEFLRDQYKSILGLE